MQKLIGFELIESNLFANYQQEKLHHALLFQGKKGIGKASFAKNLAQKILSGNIHHPDLFIIERESEKKEITVDQIRKIHDFINQTSAISSNKFIIIDSACQLNKSAANALLKILEEPHRNNFLFLISHNLNIVLPTIKSRCQIVKITDLSSEDFFKILLQKNSNLKSEEINFLAGICENSPALAIEMGSDLIKLYPLFLLSIKQGIVDENLFKIISDKNFAFSNFEKIFAFFINRLMKFVNAVKIEFYFNEEEIFILMMKKFSQEEIFEIADESFKIVDKTTSLSLDKKLSVINVFNLITR